MYCPVSGAKGLTVVRSKRYRSHEVIAHRMAAGEGLIRREDAEGRDVVCYLDRGDLRISG